MAEACMLGHANACINCDEGRQDAAMLVIECADSRKTILQGRLLCEQPLDSISPWYLRLIHSRLYTCMLGLHLVTKC